MNDTKPLRAIMGCLIVLGAVGIASQAAAQSYFGEAFVCEWAKGQGMEDLMKARDYYVRQAEKAGITLPPAYVWTPVKVSAGAPDLLWFNYYQSASEYGAFSDAMAASEDMASVGPRFEEVGTCTSGLFTQQEVFNGGRPPVTTPPAYIVSSACNFRSGAFDADALADLTAHLSEVLGSSGNYEDYVLFQRRSVTRGADAPHLRFFSVHDSAAAWGARQDAFATMEGSAMLQRHFTSVLDCTQSHWISQQVVEGAPIN
jgi:hypothetical protein